VDPVLPAPTSTTAAAGEAVMDEVTAVTTAPDADPVVVASGDEPTIVAKGAAAIGEDTTVPPPSSEVITIPQMEEMVGDLLPMPLKLLMLAFMCGDGWKQMKTSKVVDPE
jgi:hypothetical protein